MPPAPADYQGHVLPRNEGVVGFWPDGTTQINTLPGGEGVVLSLDSMYFVVEHFVRLYGRRLRAEEWHAGT